MGELTLKERALAVGLPEDAKVKDVEKAEKAAAAEVAKAEKAAKSGKNNMCYVCGFKTPKGLPRSCPTCNVPLQPEKEATERKKEYDAWKKRNNL